MLSARGWAIIGLLLCALAWTGNTLVARGVVGIMPPVALAFWRWALALALLLPFAGQGLWRYRRELLAHRWRILLLAALGISTFNTLLYYAALSTTAINISLVNTGLPVAVFVWLVVLFRQWPRRMTLFGTLLSFLGLVIILTQGQPSRLLGLEFNRGDMVVVLAVLVWGLYTVLLRQWPLPVPGLVQLGAMLLCGLPLLLPFYLWELALVGTPRLGWVSIGAVAYTAIAASLFAHLAWTHGIKVVGPALASLFSYLIPVFTALFGILLLGEQLRWFHVAGGCLTFAGLLVASRK